MAEDDPPPPVSSLHATNTTQLAIRPPAGPGASSPPALGLLASTERLKTEGMSISEQAAERQRLGQCREEDRMVIEQDALLRMQQSVSSTLNDPTLEEDPSQWLWESATDMYDYWTGTDAVAIPTVQVPEVPGPVRPGSAGAGASVRLRQLPRENGPVPGLLRGQRGAGQPGAV